MRTSPLESSSDLDHLLTKFLKGLFIRRVMAFVAVLSIRNLLTVIIAAPWVSKDIGTAVKCQGCFDVVLGENLVDGAASNRVETIFHRFLIIRKVPVDVDTTQIFALLVL